MSYLIVTGHDLIIKFEDIALVSMQSSRVIEGVSTSDRNIGICGNAARAVDSAEVTGEIVEDWFVVIPQLRVYR